jgi:hypothetical protein
MRLFDEQFGENVREAFDNYREPVDEAAWNQMKSRLQAKSKKRIFAFSPLFFRLAAAITFLIAASGSLWLLLLNPEKPDLADTYKVYEETSTTPAEGYRDVTSHDNNPDPAGFRAEISTGESENAGDTRVLHGNPDRHIAGVPPAHDSRGLPVSLAPGVRALPDSLQVAEPAPLSGISGLYSWGDPSSQDSTEQPADDADKHIISQNLESLAAGGAGTRRNPVVEVSAGSMKTWSSGEIAGGLGYTAGVSGEWKIGRRTSIHGGGLLVYNQFNLQNNPVPARHSSHREFSPAPGTDINLGYHVLSYQNSHSDIQFTALDIPVNIRFTVKEASGSRIFLSAGFSSFLYLRQKYSSESTVLTSFTRINPQGHYESATGYANLTSGGEFNAFGRFDFARFLNLSGGYVIRGRSQSLIVEPFLKYPLGEVTTLNLNIGMAGLSLKYLPGNR